MRSVIWACTGPFSRFWTTMLEILVRWPMLPLLVPPSALRLVGTRLLLPSICKVISMQQHNYNCQKQSVMHWCYGTRNSYQFQHCSMKLQKYYDAHSYDVDIMTFLLYFIILLPGVKDLLYQLTVLEKLRVQQIHWMKPSAEFIEKEQQNPANKTVETLKFCQSHLHVPQEHCGWRSVGHWSCLSPLPPPAPLGWMLQASHRGSAGQDWASPRRKDGSE